MNDEFCYDESKACVENNNTPFMGDMLPALMLSAKGQQDFLRLDGTGDYMGADR